LTLNVKILGSNAASFAHNRHHTSQLLQIQDQYFLIDCGEGTQLQLKKYGAKISKIDHIVISHLHGDHFYGLIGLLSTMHLYGRRKDLILIGPPGLAEIITIQLRYSETRLNFYVDFKEWTPESIETVIDHPKFTVSTIPLNHRIPCSGYLFKEKPKRRRIDKEKIDRKLTPIQLKQLKDGEDVFDEDGNLLFKNSEVTMDPARQFSYAYCSDTAYKPDIITIIEDADILYHEATFMEDMKERAHQTFHSTATEAATIAKEAKVGQLLIGHFSTRYKNLSPVLEEARKTFEKTELAKEGTVFMVKK
jgi:ribonuclease Z